MSPAVTTLATVAAGFPRVSGDEPLTHTAPDTPVTFSPREWG